LLTSIKVSMVTRQPTFNIVFDSVNDSLMIQQGYTAIPFGYLKTYSNPFFPFYQSFTMVIRPTKDEFAEERMLYIQRNIFKLLGNFEDSAPAASILNYKPLSAYDRYLLKTLYAKNGDYIVSTIIDKKFDYPDRTSVYIFLLFWTLCLTFALMELYKYFGLERLLQKIRIRVIVRLIESLILAQIPILGCLFLIALDGKWHEISLLLSLETWLVPLYMLWGIMFLGIDFLLKKVKTYGLQLIFNLFMSLFAVLLSYQIIYWFLAPEAIDISVIDWKLMMIPFILTLYRLIISFQKNKISGLLQEKELELSKQKELKFRSDLNALQARINPHFLYNALNSIASLAPIDAGKTEQMALSLSRLFRYNINRENEITATLKEELEMSAVYLEVEKHRFDERLQYSLELEPGLDDFIIPKFILQPLVENAVKHGVSKITGQGIINIRIFESKGKVLIEVSDNGPAFPEGLISGYGLQNTYEKLQLLYNKPFALEFINQPEKMIRLSLGR
jgi:signal transduction histidine kinase